MMRHLAAAVAGACFALTHAIALAQGAASYPSKLIRIIVPFPPGGATDIMTRNIAQKLSESWKQPIVIENRPGANGMIGADAVAKSQGDGYTYLAATIAHSANVSLYPNAPYQLQKDLQPVAILGLIPLVPVVNANSSIRSLQDLVATSKRKDLNAGSGGNGTAAHLTLELFKSVTGARIQHVPYKGGAPAMTDLLGGQTDVIFALLPECLPHVKSGRLRALAVTTEARHPLLPDVPTTLEAGISGIEVTSWNGLMVPAGTPSDIVSKINAAVTQVVEMPDMKARIIELGFQPAPMSVGDAEKFVRADVERWAKVIREANIKPD
ncbi:MAG: tripartite tricarboxylate transporter substrate binding protein [Usitatibacter sp.]